MRFYWGYHPEYFAGLAKAGLIDANTGIRVIHSSWRSDLDTNQDLAPDSPLGQLILKNRTGLLIDRGCGGIHYKPFKFSPSLLNLYARELGDSFLGVQMHEWFGNVLNDWKRTLINRSKASSPSTQADFFKPLEYGSPDEYQNIPFPPTAPDMVAEANRLFALRFSDYARHVNITDSSADSYWAAYKQGARHAMAEVGAQTSLTRIQVAAVRGAARAFGRPWGIYYEPWGGNPFSVTWSNPDVSLWNVSKERRFLEYFKFAANGGGSRAIQFRVLLHGALAGAQNAAEEWGPENTFSDWTSFELSDYGRVIKQIFTFTRQTNLGTPFNPIAIMLDDDYGPICHSLLGGSETRHKRPDQYLRFYQPTDRDRLVKSTLQKLFVPHEPDQHTVETCCLTSSPLPDAFDIIYSDTTAPSLARYSAILYLGSHFQQTQAKFASFPGAWIDASSSSAIQDVESSLRSWLPFWVKGNVAWTVNLTRQGYLIGLFNNHGVTRTGAQGDQYDDSHTQNVTISLPEGTPDCTLLPLGRRAFTQADLHVSSATRIATVQIPAGDARVILLRT
jgi:hypothetical protein